MLGFMTFTTAVRRIAGFCLIAACALPAIATQQEAANSDSQKVQIDYFFQLGCNECHMVDATVLPQIQERLSGHFVLHRFDISEKENFLRLAEYQERLGIKSNEPVSMIVQGHLALCGYNEIAIKLQESIENELAEMAVSPTLAAASAAPVSPKAEASILSKRAERMTFIAVIAAGLIDGINPCAFSTLIFFMSLLAVSKVRDGRLIAVGIFYWLASFLTYSLLGFGLFKFIKAMTAFHAVQAIFNYSMAALLVLLAVLSFRDALRFRKTGESESISLQLPRRFKIMIHTVMRRGLGYRFLVPGAFAIGIAVTLLESVCTGQVYLPTLALLAKEFHEPLKWGSMIVLYNLIFTVPLILVFVVAYFGIKTPKLLSWSKSNVVPSKVLLGLLFLALAAMILVI